MGGLIDCETRKKGAHRDKRDGMEEVERRCSDLDFRLEPSEGDWALPLDLPFMGKPFENGGFVPFWSNCPHNYSPGNLVQISL